MHAGFPVQAVPPFVPRAHQLEGVRALVAFEERFSVAEVTVAVYVTSTVGATGFDDDTKAVVVFDLLTVCETLPVLVVKLVSPL